MLRNIFATILALVLVSACKSKPVDTAGSSSSISSEQSHSYQEDLVSNAGDRVFFEFDSSSLSSESQATLSLQAKWLQSNPSVTAIIEGHCDERGTEEYNLALGERRANVAKEFLVNSGVDSSRLQVHSYGKTKPAVPEHNEEAYRQNRRAVTIVAQ